MRIQLTWAPAGIVVRSRKRCYLVAFAIQVSPRWHQTFIQFGDHVHRLTLDRFRRRES